MNSYRDLVATFAKLYREGKKLSPKRAAARRKSRTPSRSSVALIFSPHPDDECIIGALPLRLSRETKMRIINVAVTLGSKRARRTARLRELTQACDTLGFGLEQTAPGGLDNINPEPRAKNPKAWRRAVKIIAAILTKHQPRIIFFPHATDHHPTHIGTHWLVMDALKKLPKKFRCILVETEYWGQMTSPNLLVESSVDDVTDLVTALARHAGEVRRNPYHLRLPAWMQDNVRRGGELIGGPGHSAPDFIFGTLYRVQLWKNGQIQNLFKAGKMIGLHNSAAFR